MQSVFTTKDVAPDQRLISWQRNVQAIFVDRLYSCKSPQANNFRGDFRGVKIGDISFFEMAFDAHQVNRRGNPNSNPAFLLSLQKEGCVDIYQDGKCSTLSPGDFTVFDSTRDFSLNFKEPSRHVVMRMPHALVRDHIILPQRISGLPISGKSGMGRVASELVQSCAEEAISFTNQQTLRLGNSIVDVVNMAVLSELDTGERAITTHNAFQVHRARMYIEQNLQDPDLSSASVAANLRLSKRNLDRLFHQEGMSVSKVIWQRRLERCKEDLEDSFVNGRNVTEIAIGWGFKSVSHFSRVFKARYGVSPRAIQTRTAH